MMLKSVLSEWTIPLRQEIAFSIARSQRYPKDAIMDRFIDKAVYADYNRFFRALEGATRKYVPEYDPIESMILVRKMEGETDAEL